MTNQVYTTAMGKTIDLGALILRNEKVPAVGNMNVNALGKVLPKRTVESTNIETKQASPVSPPTNVSRVVPISSILDLNPKSEVNISASNTVTSTVTEVAKDEKPTGKKK